MSTVGIHGAKPFCLNRNFARYMLLGSICHSTNDKYLYLYIFRVLRSIWDSKTLPLYCSFNYPEDRNKNKFNTVTLTSTCHLDGQCESLLNLLCSSHKCKHLDSCQNLQSWHSSRPRPDSCGRRDHGAQTSVWPGTPFRLLSV